MNAQSSGAEVASPWSALIQFARASEPSGDRTHLPVPIPRILERIASLARQRRHGMPRLSIPAGGGASVSARDNAVDCPCPRQVPALHAMALAVRASLERVSVPPLQSERIPPVNARIHWPRQRAPQPPGFPHRGGADSDSSSHEQKWSGLIAERINRCWLCPTLDIPNPLPKRSAPTKWRPSLERSESSLRGSGQRTTT